MKPQIDVRARIAIYPYFMHQPGLADVAVRGIPTGKRGDGLRYDMDEDIVTIVGRLYRDGSNLPGMLRAVERDYTHDAIAIILGHHQEVGHEFRAQGVTRTEIVSKHSVAIRQGQLNLLSGLGPEQRSNGREHLLSCESMLRACLIYHTSLINHRKENRAGAAQRHDRPAAHPVDALKDNAGDHERRLEEIGEGAVEAVQPVEGAGKEPRPRPLHEQDGHEDRYHDRAILGVPEEQQMRIGQPLEPPRDHEQQEREAGEQVPERVDDEDVGRKPGEGHMWWGRLVANR